MKINRREVLFWVGLAVAIGLFSYVSCQVMPLLVVRAFEATTDNQLKECQEELASMQSQIDSMIGGKTK